MLLLSSSNRKYPPFPLLSNFSVVVCLICSLHHILLLIAYTFRENREFVFIIIVQFMMSAKSQICIDLKSVSVYLYITPSHYHHCASLSEDIELIRCLSDIVCRVCKIRHILSVMHCKIRGAVCFQFTHFPWDDWENIYALSYYHNQIRSMNYYLLFRVMSWNNGVRCMSSCILRFSGKHIQFRKLHWGIQYIMRHLLHFQKVFHLCWALQTTIDPTPGIPQEHDSTPRRLSSVYPRQATHVLFTKTKMDPSSPNANSIMWTHTSLEIKFKIK